MSGGVPASSSMECTLTVRLTVNTMHQIMRRAPAKYLCPLNRAMWMYNINTPKRVAAFISQLAVESKELRHTHELWTPKMNFRLSGVNRPPHTAKSKADYFKYWYGNRSELGNDSSDDGFNYRGRGAIQITGRVNYEKIGKGIGVPLVTMPDLLETDRDIDMKASAYFFARLKNLNHVADSVDSLDEHSVRMVNARLTKAVNGGHNGQIERLRYFEKALEVLEA